jgi:guanylate kinase
MSHPEREITMPKTQNHHEQISPTGKLVVISGFSGSGQDATMEELLHQCPDYQRIVTCCDRSPRPGIEVDGVHYHFVTPEELDRMDKQNELVEPPKLYGTSRKATPKKEFEKVRSGQKIVWRIDPSLAGQVASGEFFDTQFSPEEADMFKQITTVIFVTAPRDTIVKRRQNRDGDRYDPSEYTIRDEQAQQAFTQYRSHFTHIIDNQDGRLCEVVNLIVQIVENRK